jgi:hypothetical protein
MDILNYLELNRFILMIAAIAITVGILFVILGISLLGSMNFKWERLNKG